jgi:hypothetical protein
MEEQEFLNSVKKIKSPRKHKATNSYGVYDAYKYYRKNKPKDKQYILTESQYFTIIRKINNLLIESLLEGNDIILPSRLGKIELRKYKAKVIWDGKQVKTNLPIDWDKTLKLWYEDIESYKNKVLIKMEEKNLYKLCYNKRSAEYINKSFYQFNFNREFKIKLKNKIKEGSIDAFSF